MVSVRAGSYLIAERLEPPSVEAHKVPSVRLVRNIEDALRRCDPGRLLGMPETQSAMLAHRGPGRRLTLEGEHFCA